MSTIVAGAENRRSGKKQRAGAQIKKILGGFGATFVAGQEPQPKYPLCLTSPY